MGTAEFLRKLADELDLAHRIKIEGTTVIQMTSELANEIANSARRYACELEEETLCKQTQKTGQ